MIRSEEKQTAWRTKAILFLPSNFCSWCCSLTSKKHLPGRRRQTTTQARGACKHFICSSDEGRPIVEVVPKQTSSLTLNYWLQTKDFHLPQGVMRQSVPAEHCSSEAREHGKLPSEWWPVRRVKARTSSSVPPTVLSNGPMPWEPIHLSQPNSTGLAQRTSRNLGPSHFQQWIRSCLKSHFWGQNCFNWKANIFNFVKFKLSFNMSPLLFFLFSLSGILQVFGWGAGGVLSSTSLNFSYCNPPYLPSRSFLQVYLLTLNLLFCHRLPELGQGWSKHGA